MVRVAAFLLLCVSPLLAAANPCLSKLQGQQLSQLELEAAIQQYQQGNSVAGERIIASVLPYITRMVQVPWGNKDDLVRSVSARVLADVGRDLYDPARGRFINFVYWRIRAVRKEELG